MKPTINRQNILLHVYISKDLSVSFKSNLRCHEPGSVMVPLAIASDETKCSLIVTDEIVTVKIQANINILDKQNDTLTHRMFLKMKQ